MATDPINVNGQRGSPWLTQTEYEQLLEAAATYRERLLIRLGGEVGLKVAEMTRIRSEGISQVRSDPDRFLLSVPETESGAREAYLPPVVKHELTRYSNSNAINESDRIIDVTPRRVQMLVREVADRAATQTGEPGFEAVSAHDLRRYFARTLLSERDVSPRIVQSIGGWQSLEALDPYLERPDTKTIIETFENEDRDPEPASLDSVLLDASTRETLETAVCEMLAKQYRFAWIDVPKFGGKQGPNAVSGINPETIPSLRLDPDGGVRQTQTDAGIVTAIPIQYGERQYGTLYIGAHDSLDPDKRERLSVIGRRIGHAITAIRRQKLLLADTVLELEFNSTDTESVFVAASDRFDCRFDLESIVSGSESALVYYVTLSGARPSDVLEFAADSPGIEDNRLVEGRDSGALLEFVVVANCPLFFLTDYGATVTGATIEDGKARIFADCGHETDLRALVEQLTNVFPDSRLVGKQTVERDANTLDEFKQGTTDCLTDRQRAALQAAYFSGYFDWPRGSTAEEVADAMGVSSPTLHNHLRKGQRELLELLFND